MRTVRRQPFSISTKRGDYPETQVFAQSTFAGINESENPLTVDQSTFAGAENVYIDETGALVSRKPFVDQQESFIIKHWRFGTYRIRLLRELWGRNGDMAVHLTDGDPGGWNVENLYYRFILRCISHDVEDFVWERPLTEFESIDEIPMVTCVRYDDKIFCWIAGQNFIAFDTKLKKFVSGDEYLYRPVHELVVNGFVTTQEAKNLFIDSYRRRYQVSQLSPFDGPSLSEYDGINIYYKNEFLYSRPTPKDKRVLVHPTFSVDEEYDIKAVETPRGIVFLRYTRDYELAVAIGRSTFQNLPTPPEEGANVNMGKPLLTDDGFHVIVFQRTRFMKCRIVRQSSTDFESEELFEWIPVAYPKSFRVAEFSYNDARGDLWFPPFAHFLTEDQFVLVLGEYTDVAGSSDLREYEYAKRAVIWLNWLDAGKKAEYLTAFDYKNVDAMVAYYPTEFLVRMNLLPADETSPVRAQFVCFANDASSPGAQNTLFFSKIVGPDDYQTNDIISTLQGVTVDTLLPSLCANAVDFLSTSMLWCSFLLDETGGRKIGPARFDSTYFQFLNDAVTVDDKSLFSKVVKDVAVTGENLFVGTNEEALITRRTTSLQSGSLIRYTVNGESKTYRIYAYSGYDNDNYIVLRSGTIRSGDHCILTTPFAKTWHELNIPHWVYGDRGSTNRVRISLTENSMTISDVITFWLVPGRVDHPGFDFGDIHCDYPIYEKGTTGTLEILPEPILLTKSALWLREGQSLWTSTLEVDDVIELEVYLGSGELSPIVPTHSAQMDDTYFAFTKDDREALGVSSPRLSEDLTETLLYVPEDGLQYFADKITALHPLADNLLGVFTEQSVWYITRTIGESGQSLHSRPSLSKIPLGCRDGDEIITSPDGQGLIIATPRGIASLAPQDFVATTEKIVTYLSDPIYKTYATFYGGDVKNGTLYKVDGKAFSPMVKILSHKFWLIFYKYMDKQMLLFDFRNGSWWRWTTPYPIYSLYSDKDELHAIFWLDYLTGNLSTIPKTQAGCHYVFADDVEYVDDIRAQTLNGDWEIEGIDTIVLRQAMGHIHWSFASQRLHLNAPQNYKSIKALTVNMRGDETLHAELRTKLYRDIAQFIDYEEVEMPVNEIRAFSKRVNFAHLINFQYELLCNDEYNDRLCFDSLCVKYEVKERVR